MEIRVRFAPSPTGQVHIGNIRAALFNWLYARHHGGQFLLRIEDTDRERSTPAAIAQLLDAMAWLGLDYDEEPLYQSARRQAHLDAAERLLASGAAYRHGKEPGAEATFFRIPWQAPDLPFVRDDGEQELAVHPDETVEIDFTGIRYAGVSRKSKPMPAAGCLAGFRDLRVLDGADQVLFELAPEIDRVLAGRASHAIDGAAKLVYRRHSVVYHDMILGDLAKPLDSMKDLVIVRSDGSPVFHLANVVDDQARAITHIIRGNDHVENTFRHIFMFAALGAEAPAYAHLPMIVNDQGKPYSKRDGDAFVGDFRSQGYLPEALVNYLALLGWNPGDEREKMTRDELVAAFTLDRVGSAPARMDPAKLDHLNSRYMAEMSLDDFVAGAHAAIADCDWAQPADDDFFRQVAALMQSRCKRFPDARDWDYFFRDDVAYEEKAVHKNLATAGLGAALATAREQLADCEWTETGIEAALTAATAAHGIKTGKLNQPLRVAITGSTVGAGVYETARILGRVRVLARLDHAIATHCPDAG